MLGQSSTERNIHTEAEISQQRRMSIRTPLQPVGRKTRICKFFPTNPCLINDIGKHIQMSLQQ